MVALLTDMRNRRRALATSLALVLVLVCAGAGDAAGKAHYETRYADWLPSVAASSCAASSTVERRIHAHGSRFRLSDPRVGERVADGTWRPPNPDPSVDYDDSEDIVEVDRARLLRDRHGLFARVTVRGLPDRCNSQSNGCDPSVTLCPSPEWGWRIDVPITVRYRKRIPTTISCANRSATHMWPRKKPSHCTIYGHNQPIHAYQFDFHSIRWRHWGARTATAGAVDVYFGMGVTIRTPANLTASRPRTTCGHYAYTRLHVAQSNGFRGTLRPPACDRPLEFPPF